MSKESIEMEIEVNLMDALRALDSSVYNMVQKLDDQLEHEVDVLIKCKRDIKKVLNDHFDALARRRKNEPGN